MAVGETGDYSRGMNGVFMDIFYFLLWIIIFWALELLIIMEVDGRMTKVNRALNTNYVHK